MCLRLVCRHFSADSQKRPRTAYGIAARGSSCKIKPSFVKLRAATACRPREAEVLKRTSVSQLLRQRFHSPNQMTMMKCFGGLTLLVSCECALDPWKASVVGLCCKKSELARLCAHAIWIVTAVTFTHIPTNPICPLFLTSGLL